MIKNTVINGLGRIGKAVLRAKFEENYDDINIVAINSSATTDRIIHQIKYDSIHGIFNKKITKKSENIIDIEGHEIQIVRGRNPEELPWDKLKVDIVFECTGAFKTITDNNRHLKGGAKKVIISAPAKDKEIKTIIYGVNDKILDQNDQIISIGSCTTNCLAPIVKILNDEIGIEKGFMTTIHAYTNDQNIVDANHKDPRRARSAGLSMVPTSTGAASAIGIVLPELKGKLDGGAIRVPTPNVSMVDLNFIAKRAVCVDEINSLMLRKSKEGKMNKILQYVDEPLVSIDFNHNPYSSCFDSTQTKVIDNLVKICSWYDNEWGFSVRMLDVARIL
jgi:glyceraldehyde 3-phosphate dehydrogenase|tara:strand:- start:3043 stop:4044 length:1002 start_codon:yes stop_codon:yes gene_type:complete